MYSTQRRYFPTTESSTNSNTTTLQAVLGTESQDVQTLPLQRDIAEVLASVRNPHLRSFLDAVLHEPLIHGLTTLPLVREGQPVQFPIQIIRRTASTFSAEHARTQQEQDLLLVATVLWGSRSLLPLSIFGSTDLQDVFCTLIRSALHRLDDRSYQVSLLLRGLIGLGDEAAEQDESLVHLQFCMAKRIKGVHACKTWLLPSMRQAIERCTERGVIKFALRAADQ